MTALIGAVLVVTLLGAAAPPARADDAGQVRSDVRRVELDSGFRVIVRENPLAPVVAVALLVEMGTRWERQENAGISNFLQAVIVKGTARRTGAELAEAVAALGGKVSAAGEVDDSEIRGTALARNWRELLGLVAELALTPKLEAAEVDREREWLLSRIQRQQDSPAARAFDELYRRLYGAHPYGLPVLGTRASLGRIDHAAIVDRYRRFYQARRMVLAVSGQVSADEVVAEARRLFGGMPAAAAPAGPDNPEPVPREQRTVLEQPAQQAQILVGALAPSLDDPDFAAVKVLATVLGGGMGGRLFAELRDRQALAYTAAAFYEPVRETGALVLYLGTAPENAGRAETALRREIDRIRNAPVSAEELERAKGYLLGRYAMDRRTNERRAWYLAFYDVEGVPVDYPERYRKAVEAVSAADVQRVARTYLGPLTTVVLRPPAVTGTPSSAPGPPRRP